MNYERHKAIVVANKDPDGKLYGWIKCACVGILGDEETALPEWIPPVTDWGWFYVPDVGEIVELELNTSHDTDDIPGQSSIDGLDLHWRGKRFFTGDTMEENNVVRQVDDDFKTNYPKRRGFATPNGHTFYFDDKENSQKIQLKWRDGDSYQFISLDQDKILISNKNGSFIELSSEEETIKIIDQHGNLIASDEDGIKLVDNFSNVITMEDGVIQIISQGNIVATGSDFSAKCGSVNLVDGADDYLVRGTDLLTWLNSHTHPTGMGPSSTPTTLALPTDFLSTAAKVK